MQQKHVCPTDNKVERNMLMEKVYPRLKVYCQEQGYEFQVVDMRWGVRDEATDDHMTSELCMREIQDCQKYSTGPSFIVSNHLNFIQDVLVGTCTISMKSS